MKRRSQVKGFTLVELIVVIAIIGVLAGILVPSMLGYVNKAKHSSLNSSAKSLFNAAMTACRENEVEKPIAAGVYTSATCVSEDAANLKCDDTLNKYIYEYFAGAEEVRWAVEIFEDVPIGACIQKSAGDGYIGTYPNSNNQKQDNPTLVDAVTFARTGTW